MGLGFLRDQDASFCCEKSSENKTEKREINWVGCCETEKTEGFFLFCFLDAACNFLSRLKGKMGWIHSIIKPSMSFQRLKTKKKVIKQRKRGLEKKNMQRNRRRGKERRRNRESFSLV